VIRWLRQKGTRLYLSLLAGLLAVGFWGNTADMENTQKPRSTVAWWGLLYPDFCRKIAEEELEKEGVQKDKTQKEKMQKEEMQKEEMQKEEMQPEYAFWIVEFIKNL